jgi:hypothetical protein
MFGDLKKVTQKSAIKSGLNVHTTKKKSETCCDHCSGTNNPRDRDQPFQRTYRLKRPAVATKKSLDSFVKFSGQQDTDHVT